MSNAAPEKLVGPWLDYEGAEKHTTLSVSKLKALVGSGELPYRKVGRRVLLSVPALDDFIDRQGAQGDPT